jgi:hypothetical protein
VKTSNPAPHHEKARPYSLGHELKSTRGMMHLKGGSTTAFTAVHQRNLRPMSA